MLLNHMERLVGAQSVVDIRDIYFKAIGDYGYPHVVYAASYQSNFPAAVIREEAQIYCNLPESFGQELEKNFQFSSLPWVDWARHNQGNIRLSKLTAELRDRPDIVKAYGIAQRHGLGAARLISLRCRVARADGVVAICPAMSTSTDAEELLWARVRREISTLTYVAHMRLATIAGSPSGSRLTPRQREVLEWTSAGKTVAEVATILGLTPATVEKHLRLARDALDAGSTAHAILKAHITHQIFQQNSA